MQCFRHQPFDHLSEGVDLIPATLDLQPMSHIENLTSCKSRACEFSILARRPKQKALNSLIQRLKAGKTMTCSTARLLWSSAKPSRAGHKPLALPTLVLAGSPCVMPSVLTVPVASKRPRSVPSSMSLVCACLLLDPGLLHGSLSVPDVLFVPGTQKAMTFGFVTKSTFEPLLLSSWFPGLAYGDPFPRSVCCPARSPTRLIFATPLSAGTWSVSAGACGLLVFLLHFLCPRPLPTLYRPSQACLVLFSGRKAMSRSLATGSLHGPMCGLSPLN